MGRGHNTIIQHQHIARTLQIKSQGKSLPVPGEEAGFKHTYDENQDLLLVTPKKGEKMRYQDWTPEQRWFRSLVLRPSTGQVLSVGYPKFFNHGESTEEAAQLKQAMLDDDNLQFTEKADGSLIIRSVIDGRVHLRTRGSLEAGEHGQAAWKVIEQKYPRLKDPSFEPDSSLLLEFVSPDFRIVVKYDEDDLILTGAINNNHLRQTNVEQLTSLARDNNLQMIPLAELPREPEKLLSAIRDWQGHEGIVVRVEKEYSQPLLLKMKSADYLARHRLRFSLTTRALRDLCLDKNISSLTQFRDYIEQSGGDWELVEDAKPIVEKILQIKEQALAEYKQFNTNLIEKSKQFPERKDFAQQYAVPLGSPWTGAAFALLDGKGDQAYNMILNHRLDQALTDDD